MLQLCLRLFLRLNDKVAGSQYDFDLNQKAASWDPSKNKDRPFGRSLLMSDATPKTMNGFFEVIIPQLPKIAAA